MDDQTFRRQRKENPNPRKVYHLGPIPIDIEIVKGLLMFCLFAFICSSAYWFLVLILP